MKFSFSSPNFQFARQPEKPASEATIFPQSIFGISEYARKKCRKTIRDSIQN